MGWGQHQSVSSRTDAQIVAASLVDPDEFGVVFGRYFAVIHCYVSRRLGQPRADDLAAEVFRIAFTTRSRFDPALGDVRPWLYGIANNVVRQSLRDGQRAESAWSRLKPAVSLSDEAALVERVDAQLAAATLQQALAELHPADREALVLHVVEHLTHAEVASAMGTPIGTVKSRIARARNHLHTTLTTAAATEGASNG